MRAWIFVLGGVLLASQVWAVKPTWPSAVLEPVLGRADEAVYEKLFKQARAGVKPSPENMAALRSDVAVPALLATLYLSEGYKASFDELSRWLRANPAAPQAVRLYELAESRRPVVEWRTEKTKVKLPKKKGQKQRYRTRTKRVPAAYAPMPPKPAALLAREAAREAAKQRNERELALLSPRGRELSGRVWRLRSNRQWEQALTVLLEPGTRAALTDARWQAELVRLADFWHGKSQWRLVARAAEAAARARGPERDEALWLAGLAAYRAGNLSRAAEFWVDLVESEPENGKHFARGAWWGARALENTGQRNEARRLLERAAGSGLGFYAQLAGHALGRGLNVNWAPPAIDAAVLAEAKNIPAVRRGLALAQLGETALAQQEFRAAAEHIPYRATASLAALGLKLHLPGLALQMGRDLAEQGETMPAALYPLPDWQPRGGFVVDQALMVGIMRQESAFMPAVGSRVGAQGLMQIMPATAAYIRRMRGEGSVRKTDLHNPSLNLTLAQTYLNYLTEKKDGNLIDVLAAYNGGAGSVRRWHRNDVGGGGNDPLLFLESIPFDETRDYVEKVLANVWIYQSRLGTRPRSLEALAAGRWPVQRLAAAAPRQVSEVD